MNYSKLKLLGSKGLEDGREVKCYLERHADGMGLSPSGAPKVDSALLARGQWLK